ncbi:spore germination protein GerPC [Heyndrickxia oleronia]|jgi:spore germination protein PC|uniref:Spore germination protein GerPC n=1 Tax=Heyndrickxia oleronia TaxID=38875 RepID=A0AAW6T5D3_9BACI|nr:spore germination protein GerPC [Heyndrickxia oleronia]MCI1592955.1 spore germination protein GerPC [Heyndrickxia oleronia]MCI1615691.1 spore germination protein GerPC [Heyndrickxia oleronia]MCI1746340.1 spore germination protein GerPC [Heyndrickxia oleronia]MCI1764012.1 spore germination protein GerPC [Heyndrickxia oleronia]MDH5163506.1 spore germination protein GerPC [Heyndrickxia oleronia]
MIDYNGHIQKLYQYIQYQQKKLSQFEKMINKLSKEIDALKDKPPINVERLEYKFDQLKIERLDGTLNIGINPADLNNIEDMEIPTPQMQPNFITNPAFKQNLLGRLGQYISKDVNSVIHDTEQQLGYRLDTKYRDFIIEDLQKQLPQRVDYFINILAGENHGNVTQEELLNQVFARLKADIDQAVYMFISKLPNNMNGDEQNGA